MPIQHKTKLVILIIFLFLLTFLFSPVVNRYQEVKFQENCKEDWGENYKYLQGAYDDLSVNIWRPEEFLRNAYAFAGAWYDAEGYECFRNNPSDKYLNAFVVVLREYERQLNLGSSLSPPELPFKLLPSNQNSHVSAVCYGWMFRPLEDRCKLLFNLSPNGFYRAYIDELSFD